MSEWKRSGSLLYTSKHYMWHKGKEIMQNDFMVNITRQPHAYQSEETEKLIEDILAFLNKRSES